jgi:hypothetical protein
LISPPPRCFFLLLSKSMLCRSASATSLCPTPRWQPPQGYATPLRQHTTRFWKDKITEKLKRKKRRRRRKYSESRRQSIIEGKARSRIEPPTTRTYS